MCRVLSSLAVAVAVFASAESLFANEHQAHCRYCNALQAWADPPQASNGRNYAPDRQVDVKHIKLDVTPDFEHRTVSGTATIRFAPIAKPWDLLDDPHLNASGGLLAMKVGSKSLRVPALPLALADKRLAKRADPPRVGEHGRELLVGLGCSPGEIAGLIERHIVAFSETKGGGAQ